MLTAVDSFFGGSVGKKTKFQWTRDDENPEGVVHIAERRTWADQKKESKRISALALALSKLKPEKRAKLTLDEDVRDVLDEAYRLRTEGKARSGLRRYMLHVTSVIRKLDPEVLSALFDEVSTLLNQKF